MKEVKHRLDIVKDHLLPSGYSMNLVNDLVEQLRISEIFDEWYEDNKHLLFKNGILSIETKELLPFDRKHFTQQLPYNYAPEATCEPIVKWLKQSKTVTGRGASAQSMVANGAPQSFRHPEICRDSRTR